MSRKEHSLPQNVCLIGFMGTGKSMIGRIIAQHSTYELVDTDALIVKQAGKKISAIFAEDGEATFRQLEQKTLAALQTVTGKVIATGGGLPVYADNLQQLKKIGPVICLVSTAEEIYDRLQGCKNRPLLQGGDPLANITGLLAQRTPFYQQADCLLYSQPDNLKQVAWDIINILQRDYCSWKKSR